MDYYSNNLIDHPGRGAEDYGLDSTTLTEAQVNVNLAVTSLIASCDSEHPVFPH